MTNKCVYGLIDPRNNEIFYVGYGEIKRPLGHYRKSSLNRKQENNYKNRIIKTYRKLGFEDSYIIFDQNLSKDHGQFLEIILISYFGRKDKKLGQLVNNTDGGDEPPVRSGKFNNKFNLPPWKSHNTNKDSLIAWYYADIAYNIYVLRSVGQHKLKEIVESILNIRLVCISPFNCMMKKFKSGWNPSFDLEWIDFNKNFNLDCSKCGKYEIKKKKLKVHLEWEQKDCSEDSKLGWFLSGKIIRLNKVEKLGCRRIASILNTEYISKISLTTITSIIKKSKKGWIPSEDINWLNFINK